MARDRNTRIRELPIVGSAASQAFRLRTAASVVGGTLSSVMRWLFTSREYTNYTYDLTELNKLHLAFFLGNGTGVSHETARAYIRELEEDEALQGHIRSMTSASRERRFADRRAQYGRRLGWYALVRIVKPRVVVETGVDKGLGACVLTAALMRNEAEGSPGRYYGTDIQPRSGFLLAGRYRDLGEIIVGDSVTSLLSFDQTIDLFISDSDHTPGYEEREYEVISSRLSPGAYVVSDTAEKTHALPDFAVRTGRRFAYFQEQPLRHWWPGTGIGLAYPPVLPGRGIG
jgi:predicted O-methyltransferase YrrM